MLKRKVDRTDRCETLFLRHHNLLHLPFPVIRVKLQLPIISVIMRTMCLPGSNRSILQVRLRCHTVF